MARHFWREGIHSQGAADCARGGVERVGERFVGCYAAGGDLAEEGVDALLGRELVGVGMRG